MQKASSFVFWTTLILYLLTLLTVSYVGVYLTYVALPVIVIAGLFMKFSKPSSAKPTAFDNAAKAISDGLYVFTTMVDKAASNAEKAAAELRARAEAEREDEELRQLVKLVDAQKALRKAKTAKFTLSLDLRKGAISQDVWRTEIAKLDKEIDALEKAQPPLSSSR